MSSLPGQPEVGWPPGERWCEQLFSSVVPVLLGGPEEEPGGRQLLGLDCFLSDISDTLFTMTQPRPSPLQLPPEEGEGHGAGLGWGGGEGEKDLGLLVLTGTPAPSHHQPTWVMLT